MLKIPAGDLPADFYDPPRHDSCADLIRKKAASFSHLHHDSRQIFYDWTRWLDESFFSILPRGKLFFFLGMNESSRRF